MLTGKPLKTVVHTTKLSLAVKLVDATTNKHILETLSVDIENRDTDPIYHPDGYYLFLDLKDGSITIQVDGGEEYRNKSENEDIPLDKPPQPRDKPYHPIKVIRLRPTIS